MLLVARRVLTVCLLVSLCLMLGLVSFGRWTIFPWNYPAPDALAVGLYVFSTAAQILSALLGIYIAIFFLLAQLSTKAQYGRVVSELYRSGGFLLLPALYIGTIIYCLALLALMPSFASGELPAECMDVGMVLVVWSLLLLVPAAMAQVENLNSTAVSGKLSRRITPQAIRSYGLAVVEMDILTGSVAGYYLVRWGLRHGLYDPLGALHELAMENVRDKDRIRLTAVLRSIVQREAHLCGVKLPRLYGFDHAFPTRTHRTQRLSDRFQRIPHFFQHTLSEDDQVRVVLHIHHYLIRRAHNLWKEWPDYGDSLRQMFVVILGDLIIGLSSHKGKTIAIRLSLFTILHVCLGFKQTRTVVQPEPLLALVPLAEYLWEQDDKENAVLTIKILTFLESNTVFLPSGVKTAQEDLRSVCKDCSEELSQDKRKVLWDSSWDPWHSLIEQYPEAQIGGAQPIVFTT